MTVSLNIEGLDKPLIVGDDFKTMSRADQDAFVANAVEQIGKGVKSSLGGTPLPSLAQSDSAAGPTETLPQSDAMGNPTGATMQAPIAPAMPYPEQVMNVARGTGDVSRVIANGALFGFPDKGVAALRAASGDAPDYPTAIAQERAATDAVGSGTPGLNTGLKGAGAAIGGLGLLRGGLSLGGRAIEAGAPLVMKALGFGVDGAGAGAAQAVGNLDNGSLADYASAAKQGAEIGGGIGVGLPVAGATVGALYRSAVPFFARPAADMGRTATGLLASSITPRAAAALDTLGPDAVLADASPSFQGLAQGVAAKPGPAADLVVDTLAARHATQPGRLAADLNENLGPAMSPVELEASMTARQKAAGPLYEAALKNAPAVDTTNALATIGEHLNAAPAGSPMRRALDNARTMLQQESNGGFRPVTDARTLLNARKQLDTMIEQGDPMSGLAPGAAAYEGSPLSLVRSALDKDLKSAVPGLADADQGYAAAARGKDAIGVGRQALDGGGNAIWPEDLAARFNASPLEEQALMRAGTRSDIATQLGTNRNDLGALSRTLGDEQDFNRAKMGLLFGPDPTSKVIDAVNRERTFADTAGKVTAGSRTAPMATASKAIDEATAPGEYFIPKVANVPGLLAHAGEWAIRKGAGALAGTAGPPTREQLAQALIAPEPQRNAIVQGLLADQLVRQQRGQAIGLLLSNPAVARGLLSAYGANR